MQNQKTVINRLDGPLFNRRLGLFIHWGLYAIGGWHEQEQWRREIPLAEYSKYASQFKAENFDPDKWLDVAESAGMDYIVFTTKHHDGFCMWDTAETDYKVTNTPCGRDLLKLLADACKRRGFRLGLYYSIPDWHHPNALNFGGDHQLAKPNPGARPDFVKYLEYVKRQVTELLTNYGKIDCFFWDISPKTNIPEVNDLVRKLQPDIKINPRGFGPGDYSTPERGENDGCGFAKLTEACDSVDAESWGYRKNADYRTDGYFTKVIDKTLAKGGNFLLNVGPDSTGIIPQEAVSLLSRIGQWKNAVDESWHDVEIVTDMILDRDCIVTRHGNTYYLHYPDGIDRSGINLEPFDKLPLSAALLNTGTALHSEVTYMPSNFFRTKKPSLHISGIPAEEICGKAAIIKLEFN